MTTADTTVQSPLEIARQLSPLVRQYAAEAERLRELPRPLFEALADAGLFHMLIPRSLGGGEVDLPTYMRVVEELGKADASTAWALNQGTVWATYAAYLPPEVAHKIWFETPRGVVANSPVPNATAIAVDGGYRVTGRQGFSTGCRHASWIAAHARIVENGQSRLMPNGEPEARYLLLPVEQAELLDTWKVRGMRGTGTHHFAVNDVFVPEERTFIPSSPPLSPTGPLFAISRTQVFSAGDAAIALGVGRSSLQMFIELASEKAPQHSEGLLRDQAPIQGEVGRAEARLRSARAFLFQSIRDIWDAACAGQPITQELRTALRLATTHAIRLSVMVVDSVYNMAGTTAIYEGHPLQRNFQDIHVMSQHIQARVSHYELVGQYYLGLETQSRWM